MGKSISLHKFHTAGMWFFLPEIITSCDEGLCKWRLTVYLLKVMNTDYILEHLSNP